MTQSDSDTEDAAGAPFEKLSESYLKGLERNVEAQTTFVESWMDAMDERLDEESLESGFEGSAEAYEVWMDAAEATFDRTSAMFEGEDVDSTDFRDIWLEAANEAFKEVMATEAFAATTGRTLDQALDFRRQIDALAEDALEDAGFATRSDVEEVGERLVELERREHALERKLEEVLDALEQPIEE